MREQYPYRKLVACFELHTYSSLNRDFLEQYSGSMNDADEAIVFFSPHALRLKKLPALDAAEIKKSFGGKKIRVFTKADELSTLLESMEWKNSSLLMMSSGNFDGLNLKDLATGLLGQNSK